MTTRGVAVGGDPARGASLRVRRTASALTIEALDHIVLLVADVTDDEVVTLDFRSTTVVELADACAPTRCRRASSRRLRSTASTTLNGRVNAFVAVDPELSAELRSDLYRSMGIRVAYRRELTGRWSRFPPACGAWTWSVSEGD